MQEAKVRINGIQRLVKWSSEQYPCYVDIDLGINYYIDDISVILPDTGYLIYSIFTSKNGCNFSKAVEKSTRDIADKEACSHFLNGREARIIRVYVKYNSSSYQAGIGGIAINGRQADTAVEQPPEVAVVDFKGSGYDVAISPEDTVDEVKGIVRRNVGNEYVGWFDFELQPNNRNNYDYFELSSVNCKIVIKGNNGVSLAAGVNHYLKYFCRVHISQVGNQVKMPKVPVPTGDKPIRRETPFKTRFAYNYCTFSYTMAFWGEKEWQKELDWLALNGVSILLDLTAQEEVWRRFLKELGYTHKEIKDYIAGPAYYAWAYMCNMMGFGGPVHDSWFTSRTGLARKNHLFMRKLGMIPVLQGYSGMIPPDIAEKDPEVQIIPQGLWCSFQRPAMVKTDTEAYHKYADIFYRVQREVYGDISNYYSTDPFHEGGNPGGITTDIVTSNVMEALLRNNPAAIWIIQAWGGNPTDGHIRGLGDNRSHALILDLYAEKTPRFKTQNGGEFGNTPWIYCMLNNFGGRMGLHGHMESYVTAIPAAAGSSMHMAGIGAVPEASESNPVLFDSFFETIWSEIPDGIQPMDLKAWLKEYVTRRYGAYSRSAYEAMLIFSDTVYNSRRDTEGQGAPESVVNARPGLKIQAASTWGTSVIDYDKKVFEKGVKLLLEDYNLLKESDGYRYDLADALKQLLSNTAQEYYKEMVQARESKDMELFSEKSACFTSLIEMIEKVLSTQKEFLVGKWIEQAKALAEDTDDFTKELYEFNARALVTTWGAVRQANNGGLCDYSNRQWSGLTKDYYLQRWRSWIEAQKHGREAAPSGWFELEWNWVLSNSAYPVNPSGLCLKSLAAEVLEKYCIV